MPSIEEWRAIPGPWRDGYLVSSHGRIRGLRGQLLKPWVSGPGYLQVSICRANRPGSDILYLHRLVALAFVPNPDELPMVNHKDGLKLNNMASNLEWVTQADNNRHSMYVLGNQLGSNCNFNTKLTEDDVRAIRADNRVHRAIAEDYGIGDGMVSMIKSGKRWGHLQ